MRSYPLLIDGMEDLGSGWTYVIHASELIRDLEGAFTCKRQLELGKIEPSSVEAGRIAGRCASGGIDECRRAVDAASRAWREFSRFPLAERLAIVAAVHDQLEERAGEMIEVLISEGHPRRLAEWEISGMLSNCCPETLGWLKNQLEREIQWKTHRLAMIRRPDGVVCVSPPQNAAASNSFMGVLALIAGNSIVMRAPQATPLGVMFLYHEIVRPVLEKHGVPGGAINLISGEGRAITKSWLNDSRVDTVFFFGHSKTGLRIGLDCMEKGKKAILELSGNDGFVVWNDADLDGAADALLESFYGSTQICMVPKYAIVHPSVAAEFIDRFLAIVGRVRPGYPDDSNTILTPVSKVAQFSEMLAEAEQQGAATLCGGRRLEVDGTPSYKGLFIEPTVVRVNGFELANRLSCVREETFFPLLPIVVPSADREDVLLERTIEFLNSNKYALRNSFWSRDRAVVDKVVRDVHNAGNLKINTSHMGFPPILGTHGGAGFTGGPYGEMNYAPLRLSRLQGIQVAP